MFSLTFQIAVVALTALCDSAIVNTQTPTATVAGGPRPVSTLCASVTTNTRPSMWRTSAWNTTQMSHSTIEVLHPSDYRVSTWNSTQALHTTKALPSPPTATVTVGEGGRLVFSPATLNVSIGSTVAFNFLGLNHTLTESSLQDPCKSSHRFDSGFRQFNPANVSGKFVVEYQVLDSAPKWFFCAQTVLRSHCQAGMVFSLNPRGAHAMFLQNALAAVVSTVPQAFHQTPSLVSVTSAFRSVSASVSASGSLNTTAVLPFVVTSTGLRLMSHPLLIALLTLISAM